MEKELFVPQGSTFVSSIWIGFFLLLIMSPLTVDLFLMYSFCKFFRLTVTYSLFTYSNRDAPLMSTYLFSCDITWRP